jgi:hypothetical protein
MFRALLVHPQEVLHKRHLLYCVRVTSVSCTRVNPGAARYNFPLIISLDYRSHAALYLVALHINCYFSVSYSDLLVILCHDWMVSCPCSIVFSIALPDSFPFVGVVLDAGKLPISISSWCRCILLVIDAAVLAFSTRPSELESIVLLAVCVGARIEIVALVPTGFDPRTVQPVASRYTDRAIPASDKAQTISKYHTVFLMR